LALTSEVKAGLITAGATLAVGLLTLNQAFVGVFYDDGLYAGLATAIAGGHGYVHPNLPGMPAAVHYPPLYPVVLAPLFGLGSVASAALAAKILNTLLAAATAGLIAWHVRRTEMLGPGLSRWLPPVIVTAAACAIPVLATQSVLFAEPLFGVLVAAVIIMADRAETPWMAGSAAALALLTRSIGIALVAGAACFLLARRSSFHVWRAFVLPPLIGWLAWSIWVAAHARGIDPALALGYGALSAPLSQAGLSALAANVPDLPRPLEALAFGWIPIRWAYVVVATAALAVGLYGLAMLSRRSSIGFSLIFYLLILAVWPYPPDRFLWAVLPWLGLTWAVGGVEIWRRWPRLRIPMAVLAAVAVGGYLHYEFQGFRGRWWDAEARAISANFGELLPVVQNLPDSAVLATDDESLVWLYTRRRSVPLYLETYRGREPIRPAPAEHRAYLERMGVTHVLLASATSPSAIELRALLGAYPSWLTAVYRWSDGRWLFTVNRAPPPPAPPP
jgi:hypothetical protein